MPPESSNNEWPLNDQPTENQEAGSPPERIETQVLGVFHILREEVRAAVTAHCHEDLQYRPPHWQPEVWTELVVNGVLLDLLNATRSLLPELILRGDFPIAVALCDDEVIARLQEKAREIAPLPRNLFFDKMTEELLNWEDEDRQVGR